MLDTIQIRNYKSIEKLDLDLGLINVFIGENGAGKSNILEAIALAGAAEAAKLDNEFLTSRGIRVTSPQMMRAAFSTESAESPIQISVKTRDGSGGEYVLNNDNKPYSSWANNVKSTLAASKLAVEDFGRQLMEYIEVLPTTEREVAIDSVLDQIKSALTKIQDARGIHDARHEPIHIDLNLDLKASLPFRLKSENNTIGQFVVYSPENSALRVFEREGQLEPLGVNGEGLLKLLSVMSKNEDSTAIQRVKDALKHLSWFDDFVIIEEGTHSRMQIQDIFLDKLCGGFDQRSANEGFLFLAFYFALFSSELTPKFFAIDNVDASLNPALCQVMTEQIVNLAKLNQKQAILTTHNPAILDGLNLRDKDQRLFIVFRDRSGKTKIRRFSKKLPDQLPTRMSELFLRGAIGGLSKSF